MNATPDTSLEELSKTNISLPGNIDVQGWTVFNAGLELIGKVYDLLIDPQERKIRYLIVEVEHETSADLYKILVPIGMAELHPTNNEIILPHVAKGEIGHFSPYPYDALKMNSTPGSAVPSTSEVFGYDHEHFNEEKFRSKRI